MLGAFFNEVGFKQKPAVVEHLCFNIKNKRKLQAFLNSIDKGTLSRF